MIEIDRNNREVGYVLAQVAARNPALLIGGYHVDALIIGAYKTLINEDLSTEQVYQRIDEILQVALVGLI